MTPSEFDLLNRYEARLPGGTDVQAHAPEANGPDLIALANRSRKGG